MRESELVLRVPPTGLRPGKNDVLLDRVGGTGVVFYSVELKQSVAMEDLPALGGEYNIKREYVRLVPRRSGDDRWVTRTEPTNNHLAQGDRIRVRLTLSGSP